MAGPARRSSPIPEWTRSRSPAPPRWAASSARRPPGSGKKLSLELGGKSPFIVFHDADLDSVVEGVVDAIWFNQGQVCCAGSRILVQEGVAERLVAKLKARMETLRVGDPLDKAVDMGAIIAPVQLEKIQEPGATRGRTKAPRCGSRRWSCPREGWFFPPTLFTDVAPAATIAQVEIFGPVVVLMTFRTPAEAVELANNTRYGLAASVWTENINLALDIAPAAQGRHGLDQLHQRVRRGERVRRVSGERVRAGGGAGGAVGVREVGGWAVGRRAVRRSQRRRRSAARGAPVRRSGRRDRGRRRPDRPLPAHRPHPQALHRRQAGAARLGLQPAGARCATGARIGEVGHGNRKDIRNAVEAAHKADGLGQGHGAQPRAGAVLPRREPRGPRREFAGGSPRSPAMRPAARSARWSSPIERIFTYAAWADKYDGRVHHTPYPERHARHARADRRDRPGLPRRSAAARLRLAVLPADRDGQHASSRSRRRARRCSPPTSTRCSTPRTCRRAW